MKKALILFVFVFWSLLKIHAQNAIYFPPPLGPNIDLDNWYKDSMSDEFINDSQIDINKWKVVDECPSPTCSVNRLTCCDYASWSQCQNASVQNGTGLILTLDKCSSTLPCNHACSYPSNPYYTKFFTTAQLESINTVNYGYIEINAQLPGWYDGSGTPTGKGIYPTFWTAYTHSIPGCTDIHDEIDILEANGTQYQDAKSYNPSFHDEVDCTSDAQLDLTQITSSTPLFLGYHKFAVEWFTDRLYFYLDDQPYAWQSNINRYPPYNPSVNPSTTYDQEVTHALNMQPMNVIIYPEVDGNYVSYLENNAPFPQYMKVSYFHYWRLYCDNTPASIYSNTDLDNFFGVGTPNPHASVRPSILIDGSTNPINLSSTDNRTFRSSTEIDILPNFTAPAGCTANFNITPFCY